MPVDRMHTAPRDADCLSVCPSARAAGLTIALAWGTFCKSSGLSPLVPGQWPKFVAVYVGIYATLGTILRPFRVALAIGLTPSFSKTITYLQQRLPYASRPKLNRGLGARRACILASDVC